MIEQFIWPIDGTQVVITSGQKRDVFVSRKRDSKNKAETII